MAELILIPTEQKMSDQHTNLQNLASKEGHPRGIERKKIHYGPLMRTYMFIKNIPAESQYSGKNFLFLELEQNVKKKSPILQIIFMEKKGLRKFNLYYFFNFSFKKKFPRPIYRRYFFCCQSVNSFTVY